PVEIVPRDENRCGTPVWALHECIQLGDRPVLSVTGAVSGILVLGAGRYNPTHGRQVPGGGIDDELADGHYVVPKRAVPNVADRREVAACGVLTPREPGGLLSVREGCT